MPEILLALPDLPEGEVRLVGWLARPDRHVRRGEPLCLVEHEGGLRDIPALRDGVLRRLIARPGTALPRAAPLAVLEASGTPESRSWAGSRPVVGGSLHLRRWAASAGLHGTALLLHGFAGTLDNWTGTAAALSADGFAVVAPDLPGHGGTDAAAETPQAIAQLLAANLEVLDLAGPVHLVGHSMGAAVALLLAEARPARFASVTLVAPLGLGARVNARFMGGVLAASDAGALGDALRPLTARPLVQDPEALAAMLAMLERHRPALRGLAASLADGDAQLLDLRPCLARLSLPARLILGEADAILPWTDLVAPPQVPVHRLPCGHMPHWEQPGMMRRLLTHADWRPNLGDQR